MNQGNIFRGHGASVRDQFEGAAYKIEDNVGKRHIQGHELINVCELIEEIQ